MELSKSVMAVRLNHEAGKASLTHARHSSLLVYPVFSKSIVITGSNVYVGLLSVSHVSVIRTKSWPCGSTKRRGACIQFSIEPALISNGENDSVL